MLNQLLTNPALAGMAGVMLTGALLYLFRAVPLQLLHVVSRRLTVRLTVTADDEVFDWINEWLAEHEYSRRARTLKLSTGRSGQDRWSLAPGYGTHLFWDKGLVILHRELDEKTGTSGYSIRPRERMTITVVSRGQGRLRAMIEQANAQRVNKEAVGIRIWTAGFWLALPSKNKRSMATVFLPEAQKREIVEHTAWFFGAREWFAERGIPYRHGYLLCGPPGTGKTSLVTALSSHFNKPIYILNLATLANDNELISAFTQAGRGCIILIEDIDAAVASQARAPAAQSSALASGPSETPPGVTLSGLLNAIDGVASAEDRLLVLTSNHPGKLDPALVRSARIDKRFEIGPLPPEQVIEMGRMFFPDDREMQLRVAGLARASSPRPAADWQVDLMNLARGQVAPAAELRAA